MSLGNLLKRVSPIIIKTRSLNLKILFQKEVISVEKAEEREYFRQIRQGNRKARDEFAMRNMGLVHKIARLYIDHSLLEFEDLKQVGVIGLLDAVDRFEISRGYRFSTFAFFKIVHVIDYEYSQRGGHLIKISRFSQELLKLMRSRLDGRLAVVSKNELIQTGEDLGMSDSQIELTIKAIAAGKVASINEFCPRDNSKDKKRQRIKDTLFTPFVHSIESITEKQREEIILACLSRLNSMERKVIKHRFGLHKDGKTLFLRETGRKLGISHEWIRKIQNKALLKMRNMLEETGYTWEALF